MADHSGLINRADDVVVPLRLQTPPNPPSGAGSANPSPLRLSTPTKQGILLPPTYAQATSASAIYNHHPGFHTPGEQQPRISGSNNTAKGSGTPLLSHYVTSILPDGSMNAMPQKRPHVLAEFRIPYDARRNSRFLRATCTFGVPLLLGIIAASMYLSLLPKYPVVGLQTVKVWRFSTVGGPNAGEENPVLNLDLEFGLLASNPNKHLGMDYQEIEMLVSFQNTTFPIASMPPFYQTRNNSNLISTRVMATNAALQADDGALLQYCIIKNDIPLRALVVVKASAESGRWRTLSFRVRYVCDFRIAPPAKNLDLLSKICKRTRKGIPATYVTSQNLLDD
ncbi:uncharacterized protein At1g08160-like [Physcomitrium patens]|uniref:Uncharacterized protein n=1 Tax=Physcomitrium patens TaxID=3218 RepID=A0A2K1IWA3_PHYPA|nr:hypothetical protein PHYPA_025505 [Physcomitrium patens]